MIASTSLRLSYIINSHLTALFLKIFFVRSLKPSISPSFMISPDLLELNRPTMHGCPDLK